MNLRVLTSMLAILLLALPAGQAAAASTQWENLGGGKARLLASLDPATNEVSGVIELMLDEGWKTYWRNPGEAGIPPQFDFSRSRHFAADEVAFPVPEHIVVPDSDFVGYRGRVLFPFQGMLTNAGADGLIHASMLAGVCKEICIPATAEFEIPASKLFVSDPLAEKTAVEAAGLLPGKATSDFRIKSAVVAGSSLEISALVPDETGKAELFVEGPADWRLLPAVAAGRKGKAARFRLDLSRLPPGTEPTATALRFTLVSNGKGIEQQMKAER